MWRFLLVALTSASLLWCPVRCSASQQVETATAEPIAPPHCRCCRHRAAPPNTPERPSPERSSHDGDKRHDSDGGGCGNCLCHGALRTGSDSVDVAAAVLVAVTVEAELIPPPSPAFVTDRLEGPPIRSGREISLLYGNLRR
jgi:hypothetical protein